MSADDPPPHECTSSCPGRRFDPKDVIYRRDDDDCPTDEGLLLQWKEGCEVCFGWWVARTYLDPRYLGMKRRLRRDWPGADIEGLFADVLIDMHHRRPTPHFVAAFVKQAVRHKAFQYLGLHRQQRVDYVDFENAGDEIQRRTVAQEWHVSDEAMEEAIKACESALTKLLRRTMELRYREELSVEEIARLLEISLEACYRRLSRGRVFLVDCVKRRLDFEDDGDLE